VVPRCELPPPPFFPSSLNPYQFRNPPEISVTSYAAVGSSTSCFLAFLHNKHNKKNRLFWVPMLFMW
jgi:hypothetical protein